MWQNGKGEEPVPADNQYGLERGLVVTCYCAELEQKPGPGEYSPRTDLSAKGVYYISHYQSGYPRSFGKQKRNTLETAWSMKRKSKTLSFFIIALLRVLFSFSIETPGPGAYRMHSDFGYLDVSDYVMQASD